MSISIKQKKEGIRTRVIAHMKNSCTLLKEEADQWDTEMYGAVIINGKIKNPIKTHVSEVFAELEATGLYYRTSIPSRKSASYKQLLLVKVS